MYDRTVYRLLEALVFSSLLLAGPTSAAAIKGRVLGAGAPIAGSTVTLWAASPGDPKQLAQTRTGTDGRFALSAGGTPGKDATLYLVARGGQPTASKEPADNPAIALMTVVGSKPPATVTINEMTTVASVWTHNQFIDGTAIKGQPLQLKIAAGNVPSFVDLSTGGWGTTIQDPLNSSQTPTMANFATLANALSGCVTRVTPDACSKLYAAATPQTGSAPTDTLTAAQSIANYPWYQPERTFALLDAFYPVPPGKTMRAVPYMPYLQWAPSAWVLPLKVTGGGYRAGGKAMFDSEGNLWVGDNFTVGWQGQDDLWQGNATKFDPNGKPLSPMTTGFAGGGAGHSPGPLVPDGAGLRPARCLLSGATGQDDARGAVHAVSPGGTQRLGLAAEVRRRWVPGRRQGDVRRRGQSLGRQQLHRRLAG
jgi:hypothetical protein